MQLARPVVPVRAWCLLEHHRSLLLHLAAGGHGAGPGLLLQAELHRVGRDVQLPGRPLLQVSHFVKLEILVFE